LGHADLQHVDVYVAASPKIIENIDKTMGTVTGTITSPFGKDMLPICSGKVMLPSWPGPRASFNYFAASCEVALATIPLFSRVASDIAAVLFLSRSAPRGYLCREADCPGLSFNSLAMIAPVRAKDALQLPHITASVP
jgi:hypothetical protein